MAWIESHQTISAHPKTRKLAMMLGVSKPAAIGHLHCFWWWALDYANDGLLHQHDDFDISIGAEWEGDPTLFVNSMISVGFIDIDDDGGRIIHDWYDYAGKLIERKKANAARMKEARAAQVDSTDETRATHVQRTQRARVELPNQTIPNQTIPNQTRPDRTEPTTSASPSDSVDESKFDEFWQAYPNKKAKQPALKAFKKIDWRKVYFADVMDSLEKHKSSEQWLKNDGQFVPHPATWLNQSRWEDEVRPAAQTSNPQSPQGMSSAQRLAEQAKRERAEYEQARSDGSSGGTGDSMAGETDNRRNEPGLFLVAGGRTG